LGRRKGGMGGNYPSPLLTDVLAKKSLVLILLLTDVLAKSLSSNLPPY